MNIDIETERKIIEDYSKRKEFSRISSRYDIEIKDIKKLLKLKGFKLRKKSNFEKKIGKTFGKLKVISLEEKFILYNNSSKPSKVIIANCKCECNRKVKINASSLRKDRKHTCNQCCRAYGQKYYVKRSSYKDINAHFWGNLENRRKRNKKNVRILDFSITMEYAWSILESQKYKCALTSEKLVIPTRYKKGNASIDRIDSPKGYIEGNIQWVTAEINKMKLHYTQGRFIELCKLVVKTDKNNRRRNKNVAQNN